MRAGGLSLRSFTELPFGLASWERAMLSVRTRTVVAKTQEAGSEAAMPGYQA